MKKTHKRFVWRIYRNNVGTLRVFETLEEAEEFASKWNSRYPKTRVRIMKIYRIPDNFVYR